MTVALMKISKVSSEELKLKKLILFLVVVNVALFVGCAGTGVGSSQIADAISSEEIAGVEASLLADRVLAAESLGAPTASILETVSETEGSLSYRNRRYRARKNGSALGLRRGDGTCEVQVSSGALRIGLEECQVTKEATGEIKIVRGDGSEILIPAADASGEVTSIAINGVDWPISFGSQAGEALVTLKNPRSGMIITLNELEDGSITMIRDTSEVFSGRWSDSGDVELEDRQGKKFRYRYGKSR